MGYILLGIAGALGIMIALAFVVSALLKWESRSRMQHVTVSTQPDVHHDNTDEEGWSISRKTLLIVVTIGILVGVMVYFYPRLNSYVPTRAGAVLQYYSPYFWEMLTVIVLTFTAIYFFYKRKILWGFAMLAFAFIIGPHLPYFATNVVPRIVGGVSSYVGDVIHGRQSIYAQDPINARASRVKPIWYDVTNTMIASPREWSIPIRVEGDRCIQWWGAHPDGNAFNVQVRGINDPTWHDWETWKQLKRSGYITYNFGWVRFRATRSETTLSYKFLFPGMCN